MKKFLLPMLLGLAATIAVLPTAAAQTNSPAPEPAANTPTSAAPASPKTNAPAAAAPLDRSARNIRFQFDGMPYQDVLERFAQMAHKPLLAETNVQGTLTFNDPRAYTYSEALDTLNLILSMKHVMLVESDHYLRLVPFQSLPHMPFKVFRGTDQIGDVSPGQIVTVVLNLKNLEASDTAQSVSSMLSDAGSIAPLTRGRGLIITDRLDNIKRIQELLSQIDSDTLVDRQMRTHTLLHASGAVLADILNKTFGSATAPTRTVFNQAQKKFDVLPADPSDYVTAIFDEPSRTLVLYGPRDRVALAEELIKKFEDQDGSKAGEVRIFSPRWTRADELARMLRQAIPSVAATNEPAATAATKARLIVDNPGNRVIATAPIGSQLDEIDKLVLQIDQPVSGSGTNSLSPNVQVTRVFRLAHGDTSAIEKMLSDALDKSHSSRRSSQAVSVTVDRFTRSAVVTGSGADVQLAADIIAQLDQNSGGEDQTRFIQIGTATEVNRLAPTLNQIYQNETTRPGPLRRPLAHIVPDPDSGRFIVTGTAEEIKRVEGIVTLLRGKTVPGKSRQLHVRILEFTKVDAILKPLSDLINERLRDDNASEWLRPLVLPDSPNNRLLITATEDQWKQIEDILAALDVAPAGARPELHLLNVKSRPAQEIIPVLTQLLAQTRDPKRITPDPKLLPDSNGRQIIALCLPDDFDRIQKLLGQLDGKNDANTVRQIRSLPTNNHNLAELVPLLERLYKEQLAGKPDPDGGPATFIPDPKSNRIMVSGSGPEIARAESILREVDPAGAAAEETRVIRLETAVAADLSGLVDKAINNPQQTVKVLVDQHSNSIVLTGSPRAIEVATHIVRQLDTKSSAQPRELRILELKVANASEIAPMVTQVFAEMARDTHGASYVSDAKIFPGGSENRLLVTGNPEDLDLIQQVVQKIDQPSSSTEDARVFQLKKARAPDLAPLLTTAMRSRDPRRRFYPRVSVAADITSNSLIVSGPKTDVDEAGLVIDQLDREALKNAPVIQFINLNTTEPTQLAALATQLFKAQHANEANVNEISLTPEPSLKRLIVLAPEPLMESLQKLVTDLDAASPESSATLHLIDLKGQSPNLILPLLSRVYLEQARGHDPRPATLFADEPGARIAIIGSDQQTKEIQHLLDTLDTNSAARSPRVTRILEVGSAEDVQRLQPLLDQLYRDQLRGKESSDPADAQILPDAPNGRLIVTGRTNHLDRIASLLADLKSNSSKIEPQQTRVFDLETASAAELAPTVRSLFQEELKHQTNSSPSNALILPDLSANRLVISGTAPELDRLERIIRTLDTVNVQAANTRIFSLKSSQAAQMASILSTAFVDVSRYGRAVPRVSVVADSQSNTLIVSGQPKDIQSAAVIIEQLDTKGAREPHQMQIIPVKAGAASDLATKVRQLYLDSVRNDPSHNQSTPLLMADEGGNRLIVAASESQLKTLQDIVRQLDDTSANSGRQLRVFVLNKNSASAIAAMVAQLFAQDMRAADGTPRAAVSASPDDHTLVIDANGPLLERINQLIQTLDAEQAAAGYEVRTYHLTQGNAAELAPTLTRLFNDANRNRTRDNQPRFEADSSSNTLIVAAFQADFVQIQELMKKLQDSTELTQEIRTFKLSHGDASQIATVLESMLSDSGAGGGQYRFSRARWRNFASSEEVRVTAAPSLNSVLVQAPPQKLALAAQIIQSLDKADTDRLAAIRTVHLHKAQADSIAEAVNATLQGRAQRNEPPRVLVTPVTGSNSVLVNGPAEEVQQVLKMIQELDSESTDGTDEVRIYKLEHSDPRDLSRIIAQFLQSMSRGRRSRQSVIPNVSFDERINALIVSGNASHFKLVEQLLATLDRTPEHPDRDVQFVSLDNAQAEDVALKVNSMYEDRPRKERPVVEADSFSNSITVIARKADSQEIQSVIKRLDASALDNNLQVRMVPLDRIPADQMAKMLRNLYSQMTSKEVRIVDRLPPLQKKPAASSTSPIEPKPASTNAPTAAAPETKEPSPVFIAVEKDSNSLVLSGPARELDQIEKMISDLSFSFISSDAEFRQFRLKEADPVMVAKTLTELFKPESIRVEPPPGQGQQPRGEVRTVMPAPKIAIVAEPRTRSVIARAKPADFVLLESLIKQLDAEGLGTQLQFRLLTLTNAAPSKILPLVQQLITQITSVRPGEAISASLAPYQHAIFLVGRDVTLDQVQRVIQSLDLPAAVGQTDILLVPLRKANATQLASILNSMLQPAKTGGTSPEAQELQEQVRRLKVQNKDGKSVVLDLSKPIQVLAEPGRGPQGNSSRLILSSTPDNLTALAAIVDMMDNLPILDGVSVKIIPLTHARVEDLQKILDDLFRGNALPQFRREDRPVISVDERTNSIILAGDPKSFDLIANLITRLDQQVAVDLRNIRIIKLENADSTSLAANLQRILDARIKQKTTVSKAEAEALRVLVVDDPRTNSLLIGGSEDGYDLVKTLVDQLDKPGPPIGGRIRLIPLQNANAGNLSRALITFFVQRYQNARNPELQHDRPIIIPDLRSNSLLVSAGIEDARVIDDLLLKLDRKPDNAAVSITVIPLQHNDSAKVAAMLEKLFASRIRSMSAPGQQSSPQDLVDIEPDPLTNSLVVSASQENLDLIRSLLEKVDVEPTAIGGLIETFTLQYADAQRAATMLRSLVDQGLYRPGMLSGTQGKTGREALAITVDPRSNTLVVSASPENMLIVRQLIKQIDSKDFQEAGDIQLFPLKNAKASHVANVLEQFFRAKRAGEANSQSSSGRSIPVTVTPDDRTNTLLVTGGRETFSAIARIIQQLDVSDVIAKTSFKVFALKNATAGKLQSMLQQLFSKRPVISTGQPPDPITVVSDSWANALIVGATDEDMVMVSSLIDKLDSATPQPGIEVRVFPLAKGDARRVAQTVQSLYRDGTMGTLAPVAINVDERLNALVVSAGEADVQRIAELVRKLDTDTVARVAEIRIIELKHAQADDMALILTRALTSKPPALIEQSPNSQLLLQFITENAEGKKLIASALKEGVLITPDRRSNSLIISAPADSMHLLEQLIAKLDSDSPQLAQIRVFNLQNADARQMSEVLTTLFHLQPANAANQRSIQYSLSATNAAPPAMFDTNLTDTVTATMGSATEAVLTVTVDPRTNSLIVSGSEHYLDLAAKMIQDLDSSPAQERKSEVYRLRNSRAEKIELALKSFLDQERQRTMQLLGPEAMGTTQRLLDREVAIVAETLSNTLLVSANPRYFPQIHRLIEELDQPQAQVLIQVLLAEVTLDKNNDLGVEWNYVSKGKPAIGTGTDFGVADDLKTFGGFSSAVTGSNYHFILRALEAEGRLEVLSRPQILTADNQEAMINIGQRVPLVTDSRVTVQGDTINQFTYQDIGVQLTVTPRISPDGFVKMDVGTTNSELSSSNVDISRGVQVPIINQRKATTTVSVQSGQTIIIGGLISTTDDTRVKRVPFLGSIPYLGALFRSTKAISDRKELLIILTPQVLVKSEEVGQTFTAREVTDEQLRDSSLKDQIKRDALQKKLLDPIFGGDIKTNAPLPNPEHKSLKSPPNESNK